MASFLQNYATGIIQNAATGAATYAITTGGRVVGDVVISAGDLIEGGGRKVGDNIEGYIDRYGNWIRSYGDGMITSTAASSGGPALKALPASTGGPKRPGLKKTASDSKALPSTGAKKALPSAGAKKALPGPRPMKALPAPPGAGAATKKAKDTVGGAAGAAKKTIPYISPSPVSAPKPNKKTTAKPPGPPSVVSGPPSVKGPESVAGGDDAKPNKRRDKRLAERRAKEAEDKGQAPGGSGANKPSFGAPAGGNTNTKGPGGPQSKTMPSGKVRVNPESRPRATVSGKVGGGEKKNGKDKKEGIASKTPANYGKMVDGKYDFFAMRSDAGSQRGAGSVAGGSVAGGSKGKGKGKKEDANTPKYGQFF
ncbi:uncharacterized protein K452DRAFT_363040 [Aplosporella prunicola CBS 121167]|uniref:Uncharacterized protein n=1 Tax=Aplosporella prunicola CBS 121167 TaxID=1176127 RepID=A0A6A6AWJ6_9PEZI|nr:uncharacterized protein K452DRAFT_363040 [Aplosporella prunicola CBS 121167]KAF2135628.1 hypothetical protein K452DRAFT_363040 [Aplosporella prunicola CBS 121167]